MLVSFNMAVSLRDALNGFDDLGVSAATADVAVHVLDDLLACRLWILSQEFGRLHDLPRLAVAALRDLMGDPRFLQWMAGIRRQAFDRRHLLVGHFGEMRLTGAHSLAVNVDRAGAAQPGAAAELGAGQLDMFADNPKQRRISIGINARGFAIDRKGNRRHETSPSFGAREKLWLTFSVPHCERARFVSSTFRTSLLLGQL